MRRGFLTPAHQTHNASSSESERARIRATLATKAWQLVPFALRATEPPRGSAILAWAVERYSVTNGDLLQCVKVSRSLQTSLATTEARAFRPFQEDHSRSDLERAMLYWWFSDFREGDEVRIPGVDYLSRDLTMGRLKRIMWGWYLKPYNEIANLSL